MYRNDITRYAESKEAHKIREIFDLIPSQLDAKNNRFKVSSLSRTARYSNFESDFLWLNEAGITLPCYNCSAPVLPLDLKIKRSQFKLYLCDTGLLCAMYMVNIQFDLLQGNLHLKHDSILQNIFAQELASKNLPLVYYSQKKFGELNFVVQNGRELQIFEIKSGNDFRRHAALSKAIENKEWHLNQNSVFSKSNLFSEGAILYCPLYMIAFYEPAALPLLFGINDLRFLLPSNQQ